MSKRVQGIKKGARAGGRSGAASKPSDQRAAPARRAAYEILRRVEEEGAYASILLPVLTEEMRTDDRALSYELVLGVLRWQLWLDRLMQHYAGRPAASLDAPVRRALRLGLYQLRLLSRIPSSAAVNESVKLVHEARLRSAAGLVNAVLRRATREPEYDPATEVQDPLERVAVETSHPAWLIKRWTTALGAEEARAFALANNRTPPVAFRLNPLKEESAAVIEKLRESGATVEASVVAPGAWRTGGAGGPLLRAAANEGLIYIQDEASQLVSHVLDARPGERILDACAAPGSKTTHIATLVGDGAYVVAGDRYEHRLRVLRESARVQGVAGVRAVVLDAEGTLPFAEGMFDRVLVDAPCSGTGTLRHNPELRWRITPSDIGDLSARQRRILASAARTVKVGGRLVYSTCSVEPEENEEVVAAFLRENGDFVQVTARPAAVELLTQAGAARTWPHTQDVEGFYVAALERRA